MESEPFAVLTYRESMVARYLDPMLTDDKLSLRPWSLDDLDAIRGAGTDPSIPAGTTVPSRWSAKAGSDFIDRQLRRAETGEGISLAMQAIELDRAVDLERAVVRLAGSDETVPSTLRNGSGRRVGL